MRPIRIVFLIALILTAGIFIRAQQEAAAILKRYQYGLNLYNDENPTEAKDSLARAAFTEVIKVLAPEHTHDSVVWDACVKLGIYAQTYGTYDKAIPYFVQALQLKPRLAVVKPEDWFLPCLYLGNSYYVINRFDSAAYYFQEAETIARQHPGIEGLERLYNAFGILNFESGNYLQSRNNFEKALSLLAQKKGTETAFWVNYKSNLASSLRKLSDFDEAMKIYRELLSYGINTEELNQNIASIYLEVGASRQALSALYQIRTPGISLYNALGQAHYNLNQADSARYYYQKAITLNRELNGTQKNILAGLTHRYRGDLAAAQQDYPAALDAYQEALRQFIFSFNETDPARNPESFTGVFAVTEIYETLLAKASVFRALDQQRPEAQQLKNALSTFHSLYRLTTYVEKTYSSDEARIFLNRKKHISHHLPITIALQLYYRTGDRQYLEEAFYFDEQNKASVLNNGLLDQALKKAIRLPDSLLARETNAKAQINRLSLQASRISDPRELETIQSQLREQELLLEQVTKELERIPEYAFEKFSERSVTLQELQEKIIPADAAILSYHMGDDSVLCWVIRPDSVHAVQLPGGAPLLKGIAQLQEYLQPDKASQQAALQQLSTALYQQLVGPVLGKAGSAKQLLIIPDDEINFVPFALLRSPEGEYLFENYALTYNYSCNLLKPAVDPAKILPQEILAMAPYSGEVPASGLPRLAATAREVDLPGSRAVTDRAASKSFFLKESAHYKLLHLATHASANDRNPVESFIAFYPEHPDSPALDRIYLPEIYSLPLDGTRLAILSACETGGGQLEKGEGIISLSRAFAYAGCSNIITSQWKADDEATAYITSRLQKYLQQGKTISQSLQQARKDYLHDASIPAQLKSPVYWAHLRFTGQFEKTRGGISWWMIPSFLLVFLGIGVLIKKFRPLKEPESSS